MFLKNRFNRVIRFLFSTWAIDAKRNYLFLSRIVAVMHKIRGIDEARRLTAQLQSDEFLVVQRRDGLAAKATDGGASPTEEEADE